MKIEVWLSVLNKVILRSNLNKFTVLPITPNYKPHYINFSLLIFSIGFLFKVSAAPFHFWSPDVYDAIPTIVTTFVTIIAKISILIFLLDLISYTASSIGVLNTNVVIGIADIPKDQLLEQGNNKQVFSWIIALLLSSLLSLIIGTVLGALWCRKSLMCL